MKEIIQLTAQERWELCAETAGVLGWSAQVIEKDFWVCWTLKQIFEDSSLQRHLIFKGGTSLSKVWRAIDRFSEDIDVSLSRDWLGFGGEESPEKAGSRKQRGKRIEALLKVCRERIKSMVLPLLKDRIADFPPHTEGSALIDETDPQTILFRYPTLLRQEEGYLQRQVKVEFGARSDDWPAESRIVKPYIADAFPQIFKAPDCKIMVLAIERTFWEKVTILHAVCHRDPEKAIPSRYSRHFYDLAMLADHPRGKEAAKRGDLRERVVEHKKIFFQAKWACYEEAVPGSIRLLPNEIRLESLRRDYRAMEEMFLGDPPSWESIVVCLQKLERKLNRH